MWIISFCKCSSWCKSPTRNSIQSLYWMFVIKNTLNLQTYLTFNQSFFMTNWGVCFSSFFTKKISFNKAIYYNFISSLRRGVALAKYFYHLYKLDSDKLKQFLTKKITAKPFISLYFLCLKYFPYWKGRPLYNRNKPIHNMDIPKTAKPD